MPLLAVQLVKRPVSRELSIRITLRSDRQPNRSSVGYVDADDTQLAKKVALTAGALAEHQCTLLADNHNADQIARTAVRMLMELREKGERANQNLVRRTED